jgi:ligand-binding sensor domain-containing protein/signal transduction histidine kinase
MNTYRVILIVAVTLISLFYIIPFKDVEASIDDYLNFESITTEDGLSQNIVHCIIQDHYGYMWFGTTVGLSKYDGIDFETFLSGYISSGYNYSSYIMALYETSDGCLWVGTDYGLHIYHPETNTFTAYENDPDNPDSISDNSIRVIYEDSHGTLWIGTTDGLNVYHPEADTFTSYENDPYNPDTISDDFIRAIYEDSHGTLWIGTTNGLNVYHPETETFTSYKYNPDAPGTISDDSVRAIYEDSHGILWVGTDSGLNKYCLETDTFTAYENDPGDADSISDDSVTSICEDDYGYLWIGTQAGLNRLDVDTMTFHCYKFDEENLNGINSDHILSLYKDSCGILWIGTTNGINKLDFNKQAFKYYTGVLNGSILGILDTGDDNVWLQIGEALVLFNTDSKEVVEIYDGVFEGQNYNDPTYNNICLGADGSIWIGTFNSGLRNFDPATNKLITYINEPGNDKSLVSNYITSLCVDYKGILWVGTGDGLCSFNPDTEEFTQYRNNSEYPDLIQNSSIHIIYETIDHKLWFGTGSDLFMLDNEIGQIENAISSEDFNGNPDEYRVNAMYQDDDGLLWIGRGYRLYCYNIEEEKLVSYDLDESMPHDLVLGIVEDDDGDIWFSTRQGLWEFSPEDAVYTKYVLENGSKSNIFCKKTLYKTKEGEFLIGTMGGLISFSHDDITQDSISSNIVINDFSLVDGNISFSKPIEDIDEITLSYSENSFEIDFIALDYTTPEENQYAYMLEGFEESWNYCDSSESFTKYTNIPSGEYTFIVRVANGDGVWNEDGVSLKIIISTPFWEQWWFILSLAVLGVVSIIAFIKLRTRALNKHAQYLEIRVEERTNQLSKKARQLEKTSRKLEESNKELEKQMEQRAEFTRALAHELKTPLTPLLTTSEIMISGSPEEPFLSYAKNISYGANELSRRINDLLDLSRGEVGMLNVKLSRLELFPIIKNVTDYIMPAILRKKLSLMTDIPDDLPEIYANEERLHQILFNLLDNAIKYTKCNGRIDINALVKESFIEVSISDTGCGIDEKDWNTAFEPYTRLKKGKNQFRGLGLGLAISKMLIELQGGTIKLSSQKGIGSRFSFTLRKYVDGKNNENFSD